MDSPEKIFISADSLLRDSIQLGLQVVRSGLRPALYERIDQVDESFFDALPERA